MVLLGTLAACGQVKGTQSTDATPADSSNDADLTGTLVVVTQTHVQGGGTVGDPAPAIQILAFRPNGTVSDTQKTDSAGHATVSVFPGGTVTAIYPHVLDTGADLVTYGGVKPGDTLTFGQRFTSGTSTSLGTITLNWPTLGAQFYDVFTPCGGFGAGSGLTITLSAQDSCNHSPYEMLFLAFNSADVIIGWGTLSPSTFTPGATLTMPGWQNPANTTLTLTGLPPEVTNLNFQRETIANGGEDLFGTGSNGSPTGGAFTGMTVIAPTGEGSLGQLGLERQGEFDETLLLDHLASNATTWTVADAPLTPWMSNFVVNAPTRSLEWFPIKTTGASTMDGVVATLEWQHQTMVSGTTTSIPFTWNVIMPPEVTAFDLPTLPAPFDVDLPQPEDFMGGTIRLLEIPSSTGYDAFRAVPERNLVCPECAVRSGEIARIVATD
jgi:hypothetical protein